MWIDDSLYRPDPDYPDPDYPEPLFDELYYCRVCGCDDLHACVDADGNPCYWVEDDLCSACAEAGRGRLVQLYTEAQASAFLRGREGGARGSL